MGHQGQVSVSPNSRTILRPLNPDGDMLLPKKLNIFVPKDTGTDVMQRYEKAWKVIVIWRKIEK